MIVSCASDTHCSDCVVFTGSFWQCSRMSGASDARFDHSQNHHNAMSGFLASFDVSKSMSIDMSDDVITTSHVPVTVIGTFQCSDMSIFTEISPSTGEVNFGPQFKCMCFDINSCTLFTWNVTFSLLLSLSLFS